MTDLNGFRFPSNTLFLYGSETVNKLDNMALVYTFDPQNNAWSIPKMTVIPPTRRTGATFIADYNALTYLYGGADLTGIYANDMFILDTINLSWKNVSSINAPSPRVEYGAVFLPNQNIIIYMGM